LAPDKFLEEVVSMSSLRTVSSLLAIALLLLTATAAYAQVTPSVTVSDQAIEDGTVTVDTVVSDGPGWMVIHADQDGAPGPVIGWAAVEDGENMDVVVEIDTEAATDTLWAMLHIDAGEVGTYEFPGADGPVPVEGEVLVEPFAITGGMEAQQAVTPSVTVSDQAIENDMVTVDEVVSDGQGWIVIHADQDGTIGPVIGWAAVQDGTNTDVSVEIDTANATETLYAMLHTDAGEMGTYEFPGADGPVQVEGGVVAQPFAITGGMEAQATATPEAQPETLPETGGSATPWTAALLMTGGALAVVGGALLLRKKEAETIQIDK
jgi:LPXTG-motif cell wall-anchored protein